MKRTAFVLNTFFLVICTVIGAPAQISGRDDGMRFVPDVVNQVFYLTQYAEPLGFNITTTPDPSTCRHYQGMARTEGSDGTPFFLVTRSGNTPFPPGEIGCDDSPGETRNGHLVVFKMESRDKNGERLRSNRMAKGIHMDSTAPIGSLDRATVYFTFIGGDPDASDPAKRPGLVLRDGPNDLPPRVYQHPGGMQLVGNILAVALESPREFGKRSDLAACIAGNQEACNRYFNYERATNGNIVQFYDVSNPEEPVFKSQFTPRNSADENLSKLGVVGITPLKNGKYLMVVTGGQGNSWFFYRSNVTDLASEDLSWEQVDSPLAPDVADPHQTLNFLRQGDIDGDLFIAGARGHIEIGPLFQDRERIDLYKIDCVTDDCVPGEDITITTVVNGKRISPFSTAGGIRQLASLAAASTFYVSPSGEVIFYATEHDNDGPGGTVKAGEWRHVDVVRQGSPTLLPSADLDGPFEVDEGSTVNLTGTGQQPTTKAFLQMFNGRDFAPFFLTATYDDRNSDDFDNLFVYEPFFLIGNIHGDTAKSWEWFAPQGCSIQAVDRNGEEIDEIKTLTGATSVQADADLSLVMHDGGTDDIDQEIDRIVFGSDCDAYYSAQIGLYWDLDRNGSFEGQGNAVNFSAATLDGPANIQVPVEARHPSGGGAGVATAAVKVNNVAPQLSQFAVVDSAGNPVNTTVPWVLTGLPITVSASFADPGIPDHQTAEISWGDGTTDPHTAFNAFDEAFGDGAGSLSDTHVFTIPGTYAIDLTVTDDDQGVGAASANVRVLTPEQAVLELIAMIDAAIAAATDPMVITQLQQARHALTGSNENSHNGALKMIQSGNNEAAVAFLGTCSMWLQRAAEGGSDVAVTIALVQQVAAALGG